MTAAEKRLQDIILRRAAGMSGRMTLHLLAAYDLVREELTESELAAAIADGSIYSYVAEALDDLSVEFSRLRQYMTAAALAAAAKTIAREVPAPLRIGLNALDPMIVEALRRLDTRVMQGLAADVRGSVRLTIEEGLKMGLGPRALARAIRSNVGMSPAQVGFMERFRAELMSGDRKALRRALAGLSKRDLAWLEKNLGTKALSARQITRMTNGYRNRMLALNSETIARTIAFDTARLAHRLGWENAAVHGLVDRSKMTRTWMAVAGPQGDGRNRPHHLILHGTTVGWNEPYPNGQMVPGESDYNCRCTEKYGVMA